MQKRIFIGLAVLVAVGGVATLFVVMRQEADQDVHDADEMTAAETRPSNAKKRTSAELREQLESLRESRSGLPSELQQLAAKSAEQRRIAEEEHRLQTENPTEAIAAAQAALERLDKMISAAETEQERATLIRKRELTRDVLAKLSEMEKAE